MKKRKNIIISAITCMMSICLMMFGVYAASNPSVSISGQVSYSARDAKVLVLGKVNGQAGEDQENKIAYPSVADTSNPQEDEKVVNAMQYMGFTKGTGVNDDTDDLAKWDMNTTHAFYEDSTGIRPITISFMLRNLSNYPVVATVDFTGVTDTNLASKNLTRKTTGMTNDNKVYLDKGRAKEISITYDVANDAQGVNGNNLLDMSIIFEKTVFPTPTNEKSLQGETMQSDWEYSFDGDSFTLVRYKKTKTLDGETFDPASIPSEVVIPSSIVCTDGKTYPIKNLGIVTQSQIEELLNGTSSNEDEIVALMDVFVDLNKTDDDTVMNALPQNIVVTEGIEVINPYALGGVNVKSLPDSIKEVGTYGCAAIPLTNLSSKNLTKIQGGAFETSSLTTINLPNLAWIGDSAFESCENLTTMIIHEEDVSKIYCGKSIFGTLSSSSNLKIYVPVEDYKTATNWSEYADRMVVESIVTVGDWNIKLDKKNLTCDIVKYVGDATKETLTIPASFTYKNKTYNVVAVGSENQEDASVFYGDLPSNYAGVLVVLSGARTAKELDTFFKNSDYNIPVPYFKSIVIENGIQKLNQNLFSGFLDVQQITIPQSVTFLGDDIFTACLSLQSITLSDQISTIPSGCFSSCIALKNIDLLLK